MEDDCGLVRHEYLLDAYARELIVQLITEELTGYAVKSQLFHLRFGLTLTYGDYHATDPYCSGNKDKDTQDSKESVEVIAGDKEGETEYGKSCQDSDDDIKCFSLGKDMEVVGKADLFCYGSRLS